MSFVTAHLTSAGGREVNEDYCAFLDLETAGCWVAADGLGSHEGGGAASQVVVEAVLNSFRADSSLSPKSLARHFEAAHQAILTRREGQQDLSDMRTTLTVLLTDSKSILWGHVGDTRLYYLEQGRIIFQTKDHSIPQAMATSAEISLDDIRHHPDRNRLLRSLGGAGDPRPEILLEKQTLHRGDVFLLCTDGFWEFVTESEMEVDLSKARSPQEWLSKMESRLAERAPEENDNYTALAVFFDSPTAPPPPASSPAIQTHRRTIMGLPVKIAGISLAAIAALAFVYVLWRPPAILRATLRHMLRPNKFVSVDKVPDNRVYLPKSDLEYDTIHEALDKATQEEEIWIGSGTYKEEITIDKAVLLKGRGRDKTFIELSSGKKAGFGSKRGSIENLTISSAVIHCSPPPGAAYVVEEQQSQASGEGSSAMVPKKPGSSANPRQKSPPKK